MHNSSVVSEEPPILSGIYWTFDDKELLGVKLPDPYVYLGELSYIYDFEDQIICRLQI